MFIVLGALLSPKAIIFFMEESKANSQLEKGGKKETSGGGLLSKRSYKELKMWPSQDL